MGRSSGVEWSSRRSGLGRRESGGGVDGWKAGVAWDIPARRLPPPDSVVTKASDGGERRAKDRLIRSTSCMVCEECGWTCCSQLLPLFIPLTDRSCRCERLHDWTAGSGTENTVGIIMRIFPASSHSRSESDTDTEVIRGQCVTRRCIDDRQEHLHVHAAFCSAFLALKRGRKCEKETRDKRAINQPSLNCFPPTLLWIPEFQGDSLHLLFNCRRRSHRSSVCACFGC